MHVPLSIRLRPAVFLGGVQSPAEQGETEVLLRTIVPLRGVAAVALSMMFSAFSPTASAGQAAEAATDLPTVAVLDFTGFMVGQAGNSAPLGKAVSTMLITELSGRPGMRVIERAQLQDILTEQKLALSGRVDESTAIEIGKLVGAQYVVKGQVTSVGEQMRMDVQAVDVETSEVLAVQKLSDRTSELLGMILQIADQFTAKLDLAPPSARPEVETIPVQATISFSRALDAEDRGDKDKAIELYEKTLEIYPDHREARQALERLRSGGSEG